MTTPNNPEMGGSRDRRKEQQRISRDRSNVKDRDRKGGSDLPGDDSNERDPTRKTGIGFLDAADTFFQQPQTPQDITPPTERTGDGFRPPNDELNPGLQFPIKPPEEEVPPIVPGDPDDLGERGRRRRSRDNVNTSPVLRRGLLGV